MRASKCIQCTTVSVVSMRCLAWFYWVPGRTMQPFWLQSSNQVVIASLFVQEISNWKSHHQEKPVSRSKLSNYNAFTNFAGTEYESQWRPRNSPSRLLHRSTPCSPCYAFTCPYHLEGLDILPEEIVAAGLELLKDSAGLRREKMTFWAHPAATQKHAKFGFQGTIARD